MSFCSVDDQPCPCRDQGAVVPAWIFALTMAALVVVCLVSVVRTLRKMGVIQPHCMMIVEKIKVNGKTKRNVELRCTRMWKK